MNRTTAAPSVAQHCPETPSLGQEMPGTTHFEGFGAKDADNPFIHALNVCFDRLSEKNEEQAERLQETLEALKPKAPVVDKTTAFWNAYKSVGDEFDKEFLQKYSTDLDTTLIFAGLFSAVSSAFIIQIQPELQQDPTATNQALMRLLIHNLNGSIFSEADISIPEWNGPPKTIVWVEIFLYLSLFCTLLAALLAVLGKQWLMYYGAAGDKGSIEQRGVERQRKLDGLRKWRFDPAMQLFPLLLQFSLLIFSTALSIYMWTIQHFIARVLITSIAIGISAYTFLIISALSTPDSPFQTPFTIFVNNRIRRVKQMIPTTIEGLLDSGQKLYLFFRHSARDTRKHEDVVPEDSRRFQDVLNFYDSDPPEPSAAVPGVVWVCKTSTDPKLIAIAAGMILEMQWPLQIRLDLTSPLLRLADAFMGCIYTEKGQIKVRDGAIQRAILYGQAYTILAIHQKQTIRQPYFISNPELMFSPDANDKSLETSQMRSMLEAFNSSADCFRGVPPSSSWMNWLFRVFPHILHSSLYGSKSAELGIFLDNFDSEEILSVDISWFSNYLFFINSFFIPPDIRSLLLIDKSKIHLKLLNQHFEVLSTFGPRIKDTTIPARVLSLTHHLASKLDSDEICMDRRTGYSEKADSSEVYYFCSTIPRCDGWLHAVFSALTFARVDCRLYIRNQSKHPELMLDATWIYDALEHFSTSQEDPYHQWDADTSTTIGDLLQALDHHPVQRPTNMALRVIIDALESPVTEISDLALRIFQRGALAREDNWDEDQGLHQVMQELSVWSILGRISAKNPQLFSQQYISIGSHLASIPDWQLSIREEILTSIIIFFLGGSWNCAAEYNSILRHIQISDSEGCTFKEDSEMAIGLTFTVLSKCWEEFNFAHPLVGFSKLARGTALAAFYRPYMVSGGRRTIPASSECRTKFFVLLADALVHAAERARVEMTRNSENSETSLERKGVMEAAARILQEMALKRTEEDKGWEYWEALCEELLAKVEALDERVYFMTEQ